MAEPAPDFLRHLAPPEPTDPADDIVAEGKALAEKALGCEVVPGAVYQIVPSKVGKTYIHWRPKRRWYEFWKP